MNLIEVINEVRKKRVKFKHICLNEDMYDALTVNGHKVRTSLEREFDCCIFKNTKATATVTKVDLDTSIDFRGDTFFLDTLKQRQLNKQQRTQSASYEDILNAL